MGSNKLIVGVNDLATLRPDLLKSWDYEKNDKLGIYPNHVILGSNSKVWWKCDRGHEWLCTVSHRNEGTGCPYCSNKKVLTGYNDFATVYPELLKEWDYEKNNELGIYPDKIVFGTEKKVYWKCSKNHSWMSLVNSRIRGHGCPVCANQKVLIGYNDLVTLYPKLVKEWNYEKNNGLLPTEIVGSSNKKVWWKCDKGHEWEDKVYNRSKKNYGCPICSSHKVAKNFNDLASNNPELVKEWNFEKNDKLSFFPDKITSGSQKKVWWICQKGHEWKETVYNRNKKKFGCPICSGHQVLRKYNDLVTVNPELLKEWDYEKNDKNGVYPDKVTYGSNVKVWWKCDKGHEWMASIHSRTNNKTNCPKCCMRGTSFSEQIVYYILKQYFCDALNRHKITDEKGKFEVDIFLPSNNIAIEYDGDYWHRNRKDLDECKKNRLSKLKIKLYRIIESNNNYISRNNIYYNFYKNYLKNLNWAISNLVKMLGFGTLFVDLNDIEQDVKELFYNTKKENSLAAVCPNLINEWDYEKNKNLKPENFTPGSGIIVWWKCKKCGHSWKSSIGNRSHLNQGCPKCGRISSSKLKSLPKKGQSLLDKCPELLKEWNYEKNDNLMIFPDKITCNSNKNVWWKCDKGHEWQALVYSRTGKNASGCPYCSNKKILKGFNDLQTKYPEIALEWDYKKNGYIKPDMVLYGSGNKYWWKCQKCGNSWMAVVVSRIKGHGCPYCTGRTAINGVNDLMTVNPELVKEWNYEKNGKLLPIMFTGGSHKKVWWKCQKCGHEWQAIIRYRVKGRGCPNCKKHKVSPPT